MREIKVTETVQTIVKRTQSIRLDGFLVTLTNDVLSVCKDKHNYSVLILDTADDVELLFKIPWYYLNSHGYPNCFPDKYREDYNRLLYSMRLSPLEKFNAIKYEKYVIFCSDYDHTWYDTTTGKTFSTIEFNYIQGGLTNKNYNLRACFGHLRELESKDNRIFVPTPKMMSIPEYNRHEGGATHYITFVYTTEKLQPKGKYSIEYRCDILKDLGFDKFRINNK